MASEGIHIHPQDLYVPAIRIFPSGGHDASFYVLGRALGSSSPENTLYAIMFAGGTVAGTYTHVMVSKARVSRNDVRIRLANRNDVRKRHKVSQAQASDVILERLWTRKL